AFGIDALDSVELSVLGTTATATGLSSARGVHAVDGALVFHGSADATSSSDAVAVLLEDAPNSELEVTAHASGSPVATGIRIVGESDATSITESSLDMSGQSAISLENCHDGQLVIAQNSMIRLRANVAQPSSSNVAIRVSGACHPRIEGNVVRVEGNAGTARTVLTGIACAQSSRCAIVDNDVELAGMATLPGGELMSTGIDCDSGSCDVVTENRVVGTQTAGCQIGCTNSGHGVLAGAARLVNRNFIQAGCSGDGIGLSASGRVENNVVIGPTCGATTTGPQPQRATSLSVTGVADVHSNTLIGGAQLDRAPGRTYTCVSTGIRFSGTPTFRNNIVSTSGCEARYDVAEAGSAAGILRNNDLVPGAVLYLDEGTTPLGLAQVNALPGAANNFSQDPLLTSSYHLQSGSPCQDTGTPSGAPNVDLDGEGRDALPDVGADEVPTSACSTGNGGCDARTTCTPTTNGGHLCGPCPAGYGGNGATGCSNIDECSTNNGGCDPLAACVDLDGSFTCGACPAGYTGSGTSGCVDIDECETANGGCDPLTACNNVGGGRTCGPCPNGYVGDGESGCVDQRAFVELCLGLGHGCGLRAGGAIECWGESDEYYGSDPPVGQTFIDLSCRHEHTCALRSDGTAVCWGSNLTAPTPSGTFLSISSAGSHDCALRPDGTAQCWGFDTAGTTPAPSGTFLALSSGGTHTCGLRPNYTVTCWGDDQWDQTNAPPDVFQTFSTGGFGGCGILGDGTLKCWGWQGIQGFTDPPPGAYVAVSAGSYFGCAQSSDGHLTCWGDNYVGELMAPSGPVKTFVAGERTACAVRADDSLVCWGSLGTGTPPPR
ncbi:MAG TPA: EGF domain-containing protein, partial [Polyangiaceae bacterium]